MPKLRLNSVAGLMVGLVHPPNGGVATGNLATALRWQGILDELGHASFLCAAGDGFEECWEQRAGDSRKRTVMVALNAVKCHREIVAFRKRWPEGGLIVAVTGTDMNGGDAGKFEESLTLADRIIVLHEAAGERLAPKYGAKTVTIFQSVAAWPSCKPEASSEGLQICVVGHLRAVKDPLRCAMAVRLLPSESEIFLKQAGAILESPLVESVAREERENSRYRYLGELSPAEAGALIAESNLLVLTSISEGGPLVVAEAAVAGTPVITSRIDGAIGMLGADYAGYFEAGDEQALGELLVRFERDQSFRDELTRQVLGRAELFRSSTEKRKWQQLLEQL